MKKTIYKYHLDLNEAVKNDAKITVAMPIGARIMHVALQGDKPTIWAEVDADMETRERTFLIVGTGNAVPAKAGHIGTVQMRARLGMEYVWHIYEQF